MSVLHRVAAAFPKLLLPQITLCIYGTVSITLDPDLRILVRGDKQQQVPLGTEEGQSHVGLYMCKPGYLAGVVWSCLWVWVTSQAVEFCILPTLH